VEDCGISCADFHHADHVRLAWIYLRDYTLIDAIERFTRSLRHFAAHCGGAEKYHETITWAYLLLIHERMHRNGGNRGGGRFRAADADPFRWKPSLLQRHFIAPN